MIADRIKALREQSGMTQTDLAKILGITRSSVNAWEQGISIPSTQYLIELSRLFRVSTDILLNLDAFGSLSAEGLNEDDIIIVQHLISHLRIKNIGKTDTKIAGK